MKKKCFLFLVVFVFFVNITSAQQWKDNLPDDKDGNYSFFDYQNAFNDYWNQYNVGADGYYHDNDTIKRKATGYKQFKRWEWYWAPRVDHITGEFTKVFAFDIWNDYKATNGIKSIGGTWVSIGDQELDPLDEPSLQESGTGRINCAAFDPDDNNHFWVGSPAGGLWETTDGGSSWTCKTDNELILGVSDIALSPNYSSDNTIYIATGDRDAGDDPSLGVLKSTDDGATWFRTDLKFKAGSSAQTVRVIVDPGNANTIYAATSVGFYKSTDGGTTFAMKQAGNFIDMDMIPGSEGGAGGADLIATTNTASAQAWRSTDAGETWAVALTANAANEDRMDIAVTPADPNYVYVITAWDGGAIGEIYRSTNGGASFSSVYDGASSNNLFAWDQTNNRTDGGQGFYDVTLAVSATNRNVVYVGGVNAFISTNGASSFVLSNRWDPAAGGSADEVHADHHNAYFRPSDDRLFDCNDGGFYYTDNATSGSSANWIDITDGLVTGQLYDIGVSQTEPGSVVAGYQDNGAKYRDISTSATDWEQVREGDGMESEIDPTNVNNQWTSYPTGYVFRTTNEWASYTTLRSTNNAAWSFPIEADPQGNSTVYIGAQEVERYVGTTKTTLSSIGATLLTMDVYHVGSDLVIWTGSSSDLWKSNTSGGGYTSVYSGLPGNQVMDIAIDDDDYNHVYVSLGGYDYNAVYETTDGGSNWTDISSGLPPVPVGAIVINEQNTTEHEIYAGTDLGIFVKVGNEEWRLFNDGFPVVSITELEIYYDATPANSKIYAGTYGRDTWVSDLLTIPATPMTYVSSTVFQNNPYDVFQGTVKNEIIGIEVVTNGSTSPLDITSFSFNTNGSTDAVTDIANAKVYYSGSSNVFGTATQFGTIATSPNGNFTVTGTQTLNCGKNYFWLTYDIEGAATLGDYVDAECTSITVGTAKTPTVTAPVGNREIATGVYCDSYSSDLVDGYGISRVVFNTIDNGDGTSTSGHYNDYTAQSTSVNAGSSYNLNVTLKTSTNTFYATAWIDWNQDYDFDDAGEVFNLGSNASDGLASNCPYSVPVPVDAVGGDTRMRIVATFDSPATSCGEYRYGETEDYTVTVVPLTPMAYVSSTTTQNNTSNVTVGTTDAEIVGVEIVTSGATSPLDATSFSFSTNGSTNASGDLTNAKLYYTGTSSTFATSNLFDTQASPNGAFSLTGSQTLSSGTNYFWLVYDVNAGATGGNLVDAECTSLTVGSAHTPTVQAPAGNRPIVADPCLLNTFPYVQNFDSWTTSSPTIACTADGTVTLEECWTNIIGDAIDWDILTGSTGSNNTGPSNDHTGGGNYLYTEASGPCNSTGSITTPKFDLTSLSDAQLTFWYHMYGADMNELSVQISTNGGSTWSGNVWVLSGDQGNSWIQATVDLTPYVSSSNVVIRFTGDTGTGWSSDMAIDDVNIDGTPAPTGITWNGSFDTDWQTQNNWTPNTEIPTSTDDVTIPNGMPNYPVIDDGVTTAECADLEIENTASVTIAVNGQMTVAGSITNSASNAGLVILSDDTGTGSLIHNTSGGVDATVNCRMSSASRQWHMVSSPVMVAPFSVFSTTSNLYYYDEATADYWTGTTYDAGSVNGWFAPSGNMNVAQGYVYNYYAETLTYTGQLNDNTSTNSLTIRYTDNGVTAPNSASYDDFDGWNFLGNPYTSAIDWDNAGINHAAADLLDAVYYYDDKTAHNYASYVAGVGTNGGTQYIPAMQGFFVKSDANTTQTSTLDIPAAALVHNSQAFWKNNNYNTTNNLIRLSVNVADYTDETVVRFVEDATNDMDGNFDAYKLFTWNDEVPQMYTRVNGASADYSINSLAQLQDNDIYSIPLLIETSADKFTLTVSELNFDNITVYLKDNNQSVNNFTELSNLQTITFANSTYNAQNRFELVFEKTPTLIDNNNEPQLIVYPNPSSGSFYLNIADYNDSYDLIVSDIAGKVIYTNTYAGNEIQNIELNVAQGVYFINIKMKNSQTFVQKIIVQ